MRLHVALAAATLALAGCDDSAARTDEPSADARDCPLMVDDDSDPDQIKGEPGTYAFTARGEGAPAVACLDLPAGYTNFGQFALWPSDVANSDTTGEDVAFRGIQYWTVNGVYDDPCVRPGHATEAGSSVEELAEALEAQPTTETTDPVPVTLDGHDGLYLEQTLPSDVKVAECTDGYYMLWEGAPGDQHHWVEHPGTVERTWIVDVDGVRAVFVAIGAPGVTSTEFDELSSIVESVEFVEP